MSNPDIQRPPPSYKTTKSIRVRELPTSPPPLPLPLPRYPQRHRAPYADIEPLRNPAVQHELRLQTRYKLFNISGLVFGLSMFVTMLIVLPITKTIGGKKDPDAAPTEHCRRKSADWYANFILGAVFFGISVLICPLAAVFFRRAWIGLLGVAFGFFLNAHTCYWGYNNICPPVVK